MPELHFLIEGAEAVANAATPMIALKLRIANLPAAESIQTLTLRCQVQIEPARRSYLPKEREQLLDLFGEPERWGRTVRPLLWMNTSVAVPAFTGSILVDLGTAVHLRLQRRHNQVLPRSCCRRNPLVRDVQRHRLLPGRR